MNFSLYIYGTPNGYNQYPADSNSVSLQEFAQNNTTESQLTVCRKGQLVYYAYMRRLQEKTNHFLGFCLGFNGVYCNNPQKLFSLFDRAFDDVLMKGELLKFEKGKCLYTIGKFTEKQVEIDRIKTFLKDNIESDFSRDFVVLKPSFKVGNGSKTISVRDSGNEILAAITEFDCVHITNNEKTLSELERTHKLLTELYAEKEELNSNYRKLVAQKKQYKFVFVLLLAVIACGIGLFTFNKNLQSKDSQIRNLNSTVNQQRTDIKNLNTNIVQLQAERESLTAENSGLTSDLQTVRAEKERLSSANAQLDSENDNLKYTVQNLESQNSTYKSENRNLSQQNRSLDSEVSTLKKQIPVWYQATSKADFYYKYKCNNGYNETNCYISTGNTVQVYKVNDNYGLTEYGWIKMSSLKKY